MDYDTYILEQAAEIVYERPEQHGNPEDSFQIIADFWNVYLRAGGIPDPNITAIDVAYLMILLKIARSLEGVYHDDNPKDIAGYAENVARIQEETRQDGDLPECYCCGVPVSNRELSDYKCDSCGENPWRPVN